MIPNVKTPHRRVEHTACPQVLMALCYLLRTHKFDPSLCGLDHNSHIWAVDLVWGPEAIVMLAASYVPCDALVYGSS